MSSSTSFAGPQDDLAPLAQEGLDRRFLARDAGDDDVAVVGGVLLAHDHVVAVEDPGVDHRVAPDPEHEQVAVAGEVLGEGHGLFDVLGGAAPRCRRRRHRRGGRAGPGGGRRSRRSRARSRSRSPGASWGPGAGSPCPAARRGARAPWSSTTGRRPRRSRARWADTRGVGPRRR